MKILVGGKGKMGSLIAKTAEEAGHEVVGLADAMCLDELKDMDAADMVIDFSHRDNLTWIVDYVKTNNAALVYGTTGLTQEQLEELNKLSETNAVFYSTNYSYGIAALKEILKVAATLLKDSFDMELVETHHNQKQDAPSGTATTLLSIINPDGEFKEVFGRKGMVGARQKEIGVHALRGGTEAGEHVVHFFGDKESITIGHHATDRQIFVNGAIRAAEFLEGKPAGMYNMDDLIAFK